MIVRWPNRIEAGAVNQHIWYFADVLPTLAELTGSKSPERIDGISVVPTLLGSSESDRKQRIHEFLYWEHRGERAVRSGRWKAIRPRQPDANVAIYDLVDDVGETNDVSKNHPDVVTRLTKYMETAHTNPRPQIEPPRPIGRKFQ